MYTLTDSAPSGLSLFDFPAPAGRVIAGAFDEARETNITPLFMLSRELNAMRSVGPRLTQQDAADVAKRAGVKVKVPEDGITAAALGILIERRRDDAALQMLYARNESLAVGFGKFGASIAGTLMDPFNIAAGFIPVVAGTRIAAALAAATTATQRAGLRGAIAAAEGAVGATVMEVPTIALRRDLQDDYGLYDSLANIAFGTVASSGLRMVGGAARDRWRGLQAARQEDFLRSIAPEEWAAARLAYERQLERGMFEDLEGGFARGAGPSEQLLGSWQAGRAADDAIERMQRRMSDAEVARFIEAETQMRREAAAPDADDRVLLDAAGVAERKFREMDLAEVKGRLERGEGLIIVPGNQREVLAAVSDETHAHALKVAVAQAIEGRRIDVDPVVRQDPVFGPQRMSQEEVRRRAQSNMAPESKVGADAEASRRADRSLKETEAPAANRGGRAEPPPPRGDVASGEAAGAEAKPAELVEAEALLERTRTELQQAANDAGLQIQLPEASVGIKQSEDYARAWRAIAACATGRGL